MGIIYYVIIAILFIIALILGFTRSMNKSITRTIAALISLPLSILVTKLISSPIVKLTATSVLKLVGSAELDKLGGYLFSDGAGAVQLLEFIGAFIAPFLFVTVFIIVDFILWIVYAVVAPKIKYIKNDSHPAFKAGSVGLNLFVCFLTVTAITVPFSFISERAEDINKIAELPESINDNITLGSDFFTSSLTAIPERLLIPSITSVKSNQGSKSNVGEAIGFFIDFADELPSIIENIQNEDGYNALYSVSEKLENYKYADELLGSLVADLPKFENELGGILGDLTMPNGSEKLTEKIKGIMVKTTHMSSFLKMLGNMYAMTSAMSDPGSPEKIELLFSNINTDTSDAISELLDNEVVSELMKENEEAAKAYTDVINKVASSIASINENTDISEEERSDIIKNEAAAFSSLITYIENPSTQEEAPDVKEIIEKVTASTVLTDVITDITDGGNKTNPFDIEAELNTDEISNALIENGFNENDEFYKSFMALLPTA